ncbi:MULTISPECIES: C1 family peptidase [Aerosakkonema]|uniref:C1 family peptidase n=1 Tax=Aerosakkonema TaxID=1246629 RepID=UPI0035BB17FF
MKHIRRVLALTAITLLLFCLHPLSVRAARPNTVIVPETYVPQTEYFLSDREQFPVRSLGLCGSSAIFSAIEAYQYKYRLNIGSRMISVQNPINNLGKKWLWDTCINDTDPKDVLAYEADLDHLYEDLDPFTSKCDPDAWDTKCAGQSGSSRCTGTGLYYNSYDVANPDPRTIKYVIESDRPVIARIRIDGGWAQYHGGVYHNQPTTQPNFVISVTIWGFGHDESDGDYWLVKNNWGPTWGNNGWIQLKIDTQTVLTAYALPQN